MYGLDGCKTRQIDEQNRSRVSQCQERKGQPKVGQGHTRYVKVRAGYAYKTGKVHDRPDKSWKRVNAAQPWPESVQDRGASGQDKRRPEQN